MKELRHSSFALYVGLALTLAGSVVPLLTAQDAPPVVGEWTGTLNPGGQPKKQVVVHISAEQDGSLRGTIDYPDQAVSGVLITVITYSKSTLHFESTPGLCAYEGTMDKDSSRITGVWKQGGTTLDLVLKAHTVALSSAVRRGFKTVASSSRTAQENSALRHVRRLTA